MNKESWKDIPGFEGKYQASTFGRIKSLNYMHTGKEHILSCPIYKTGYRMVCLCKDGKQYQKIVHRLIALTFIENPKKLPCVNHKDENKLNNNVNNLEWCTYKYNNNYGTRNKRNQLSHKRIPIACYDLDGNLIKIYESISSTRKDGFINANVYNVLRGIMRQTHGCIFKYIF